MTNLSQSYLSSLAGVRLTTENASKKPVPGSAWQTRNAALLFLPVIKSDLIPILKTKKKTV